MRSTNRRRSYSLATLKLTKTAMLLFYDALRNSGAITVEAKCFNLRGCHNVTSHVCLGNNISVPASPAELSCCDRVSCCLLLVVDVVQPAFVWG